MIEARNILCISTPAWEGPYASTTVQLMKELGSQNKILFVNNPFTLKDVADGIKKKKTVPVKKVFGFKSRLKIFPGTHNGSVYVLTPPMVLTVNFLPKGYWHRAVMNFNGWLLKQTIRKYLKKLDMEEELVHLVSFNPALGLELGRQFNEKLLLYLCYDEISAAPHLKKHGIWQEERFAKMADATIVTSQGLLDRKKHIAKNCYLVRNGANFGLFSKGFNAEIGSKKVIGFIGGIDRRLDYPLLEHLISSMPEAEFRFVGRINFQEGADRLRKFPNVVLSGSRPLAELPEMVRHFSVGIIPFKLSDFIKTVYPLKINEYLAAGVPVVTTNFSYLNDFASVVRIAENKEEFCSFVIEEALNDSVEKKRARQELAKLNSWEHRAEELSQIITKLERSMSPERV
ncbi:MAG TPA: glycosyltransferase [Flavisolibacter sp.]